MDELLRHGREELIAFGRAAADAGLLASTCGNASVRLDPERMLITGAGAPLASLTPDDLVVVRLRFGDPLGGRRASMEAELHRRAYLTRPLAGAVLHCQSRAATLVSCVTDPPECLDLIPEIPAYVRRHSYVPYAAPGSPALANMVASALEAPDVTIVQMRNHGQVILGDTWDRAVRRGVFFELACWIWSQGLELTFIGEQEAERLRDHARDV